MVKGGELFDRIVQKTNYTEKEARDLIKVCLETLAYLAENGVVHRDIKPENILLFSNNTDTDIKFADFGFAKFVSDLHEDEPICGTPGYVAPEILKSKPYGCEVDIWSMGVICYILFVGYPPFYDDDQNKLFRKIKDGRFRFHEEYWKNISLEAMDMITKMLCVNQKKRWTAKQLLEHPWITRDVQMLANKSLNESKRTLQKFNARRRFRAAIETVIFTRRLSRRISPGNKSDEDATQSMIMLANGVSDPPSFASLDDSDANLSIRAIPTSETSSVNTTKCTVSVDDAQSRLQARSDKRSVRFAPIEAILITSAVHITGTPEGIDAGDAVLLMPFDTPDIENAYSESIPAAETVNDVVAPTDAINLQDTKLESQPSLPELDSLLDLSTKPESTPYEVTL